MHPTSEGEVSCRQVGTVAIVLGKDDGLFFQESLNIRPHPTENITFGGLEESKDMMAYMLT